MELIPDEPPGRSTRKARAYTSEIQRLHAAGYTLAAIRRTLRAAGIDVSISTVQREAARPTTTGSAVPSPQSSARSASGLLNHPSAIPPLTAQASPLSYAHDARTGKQIVEEFMKGRTTNPLLLEGN